MYKRQPQHSIEERKHVRKPRKFAEGTLAHPAGAWLVPLGPRQRVFPADERLFGVYEAGQGTECPQLSVVGEGVLAMSDGSPVDGRG